MKSKMKNHTFSLSRYNLLIIALITVSVIIIGIIWIWYGHKNEMLEQEIYKLR